MGGTGVDLGTAVALDVAVTAVDPGDAAGIADGDDAAATGSLVRASRRRTPPKTTSTDTRSTAIEMAVGRRIPITCMTRGGRWMLRRYPSL